MSYPFLPIGREHHVELLPVSLLVRVPLGIGGHLLHNDPLAKLHFQSSGVFGFWTFILRDLRHTAPLVAEKRPVAVFYG